MDKNNPIMFGSNTIKSGLAAVEYLEEAWDQEITLPPEHAHYNQRISKLEELIQKQDGVDFTTLVMTAPVDEWNKRWSLNFKHPPVVTSSNATTRRHARH